MTDTNNKRWLNYLMIVGHLYFLASLILSVVFYKERILFADSAYYLFNFIDQGVPFLPGKRFGQIFTQIVPVMGARLHLPLKWLVVGYSLNVTLFLYACYIITGYLFKSKVTALSIILLMVVMIKSSFFWPISTTLLSITVLLVAYSLMLDDQVWKQRWKSITLILLTFTAIYLHPLCFIAALFLIGYEIIRREDFKIWDWWLMVLFVIILFGVKYYFTPEGSYEDQKISPRKVIYGTKHLFSLTSFYFTGKLMLWHFLPITLMYAALLAWYIINKSWLKLTWVSIFFFGHYLLVITSFPYAAANELAYTEQLLLPIGIVVIIPTLMDVFSELKKSIITLILFVSLICINIQSIIVFSNENAERIAWLDAFVAEAEARSGSKFIMDEKNVPVDMLKLTWAIPYESIIYSAMNEPDNQKILLVLETEEKNQVLYYPNEKMMIAKWAWIQYEELNPHYFKLPTEKYKELESIPYSP